MTADEHPTTATQAPAFDEHAGLAAALAAEGALAVGLHGRLLRTHTPARHTSSGGAPGSAERLRLCSWELAFAVAVAVRRKNSKASPARARLNPTKNGRLLLGLRHS